MWRPPFRGREKQPCMMGEVKLKERVFKSSRERGFDAREKVSVGGIGKTAMRNAGR